MFLKSSFIRKTRSFGVLGAILMVSGLTPSLQAQDFIKNLITKSPGPLSNPHHEYDAIRGCISCHAKTLGGEVENAKCSNCHNEIKIRLDEKRGYHKGKFECEKCHTEHKGLEANIFAPDNWRQGFDHEIDTGFDLVGKHKSIECQDCHSQPRVHYKTKKETKRLSYLDSPTTCLGCHQDNYLHDFKNKKLETCTICHSTKISNWTEMSHKLSFDHDKQTDYQLEGLHEKVKCNDCHIPDAKSKRVTKFAPLASNQCTDCHTDPHKGKFGSVCTTCHSVYRKWDKILAPKADPKKAGKNQKLEGFDHGKTNFPLVGYHQAVTCESCHYQADGSFKFAKGGFDECSDCHGRAHNEQFKSQACTDCHQMDRRFYDSTFGIEEHNRLDFKLDGKHQVLDCQKCHFSGQYENLSHSECSDCHRNVHPERQIDKTCNFCHVTTSFSWIQFDHNKQTDFQLTGRHREVACLSCHVDQVFKNMPASNANPNCQACHQDPHGKAMPNTCADCHRTEGFKLVRNFDHAKIGSWELTGRHTELSCQKCHTGHLIGDYKTPRSGGFMATDCASCHTDIHRGKFGSSCQSCHNTSDFEVEQGEKIHDLGFFKLEGVHDQMNCQDCHSKNASLMGAGQFCAWCHEKNDIHLGQFGGQCEDCHNQTAWLPSKFKHNTTGFRLTGAHRHTECSSCHVNQIYQGLPNDCYFCHSDSFVTETSNGRAITPHNGGAGVALADCGQCHSSIDWNIQRGPGISLGP
ncbi:MAG: hypothetical protein COV44_03425 [Deltaproteobacteria bacterium CG11_big_fil_rev_8_21_14_0_20_45_16]|nr:MAG: hypothetical protein COV44_03425 [Deltaproteobacteria bacterium CG11_big_fil_rev_8_21_14_0_20_45_16]